MSITLTSTAISSPPLSPVEITSINLSFTPLEYTSIPANTTHALSPPLTNPQYANNPQGVGVTIPGPGTAKIDGTPILGSFDGANLQTAFTASGLTSVQYNYRATLTYNCKEKNTDARLSVTQAVGVEVHFP
jgi:hypothetical protein